MGKQVSADVKHSQCALASRAHCTTLHMVENKHGGNGGKNGDFIE